MNVNSLQAATVSARRSSYEIVVLIHVYGHLPLNAHQTVKPSAY